MHIIFFAAFYYPYRGGYVESIYEVSHGLVRRGFTVTIVTCNTHAIAEEENHEGVRVVRIPCWSPAWLHSSFPLPKPWAIFSFLWRFRGCRLDAIITETRFYPTTFLGFLIGFFRRIPVVHVEQGSCHPASHNFLIRWMGLLVDHTFGSVVCRSATVTVGVSAEAAAFARHLGARNPFVIYNPVDIAFWHSQSLVYTKDDFFRILFVGRLVYAKGAQDLLYSLVSLRASLTQKEFSRLRCIVIGDGPYRASLVRLIESLSLSQVVIFLGECGRAAIREELWQASVFVNPSYSEGLPVCVLEAAACAVPIIATDVGGTREIISAGCGLLILPRSPDALAGGIARALRYPAEFRRYGIAARARSEDFFSTPHIVDAYESTLRSATCHA